MSLSPFVAAWLGHTALPATREAIKNASLSHELSLKIDGGGCRHLVIATRSKDLGFELDLLLVPMLGVAWSRIQNKHKTSGKSHTLEPDVQDPRSIRAKIAQSFFMSFLPRSLTLVVNWS